MIQKGDPWGCRRRSTFGSLLGPEEGRRRALLQRRRAEELPETLLYVDGSAGGIEAVCNYITIGTPNSSSSGSSSGPKSDPKLTPDPDQKATRSGAGSGTKRGPGRIPQRRRLGAPVRAGSGAESDPQSGAEMEPLPDPPDGHGRGGCLLATP